METTDNMIKGILGLKQAQLKAVSQSHKQSIQDSIDAMADHLNDYQANCINTLFDRYQRW